MKGSNNAAYIIFVLVAMAFAVIIGTSHSGEETASSASAPESELTLVWETDCQAFYKLKSESGISEVPDKQFADLVRSRPSDKVVHWGVSAMNSGHAFRYGILFERREGCPAK